MNVKSAYMVQFQCPNVNDLKATVAIQNEATSFLMPIVMREWDYISTIEKPLERQQYVERLIHSAGNRIASYLFDRAFPNFPSYLRRAVIQKAIGKVSSFKSNRQNWIDGGMQGNEPTFQTESYDMPTFYKDNMYKTVDGKPMIKVYNGKSWVFMPIKFKHTDWKYIQDHWTGVKMSAPTLKHKHKKWFLEFVFEENNKLSDKEIFDQTICAVDLGVNTDAVCSIMKADGTILNRKFINFGSEKGQIHHLCQRIRCIQQRYCSKNAGSLWRYATHLNDEHAKKVANAIVSFAIENNCDCIVFEALNFKGKKYRGKNAQKLSLWRKNGIQEYATHDAHRHGIRVSHICAWRTSKLAYDGSGTVVRDKTNYSLCTFKTGKRYNCDLSASYNIGSSYFVRGIEKSISKKDWSHVLAKVPDAER